MKDWPDKLKLLSVLSTTRLLVGQSKREGWPDEQPKEIGRDLDQIINSVFFQGEEGLPKYWGLLYVPTGPLQEISISNGWAEAFLKLAEEFDSLEYLLKEYEKAEPGAAANASRR